VLVSYCSVSVQFLACSYKDQKDSLTSFNLKKHKQELLLILCTIKCIKQFVHFLKKRNHIRTDKAFICQVAEMDRKHQTTHIGYFAVSKHRAREYL